MSPGRFRGVAAAAVLAAIVGLGVYVTRIAREPVGGAADAPFPVDDGTAAVLPPGFEDLFTSNDRCATCHAPIHEEILTDQHPQAWFNGTFFPQDPRRTECTSCHAPQPILEVGITEDARIRGGRYHEGVGCIECHKYGNTVRGPLPTAEAPCNPVEDPRFRESIVCSACHALHGTLDQWADSRWGREGVTCQACHMPWTERPTVAGGSVRRVRSHRMLSQRDSHFLQGAVSAEARIAGNELVVSVTNGGTGHHFPGEIFNREVFLKTTIRRTDTAEPLAEHRESMKTPRRNQRGTEPSTQLAADETRTWRYPLPDGPLAIRLFLGYRLSPTVLDADALPVWEETLMRE